MISLRIYGGSSLKFCLKILGYEDLGVELCICIWVTLLIYFKKHLN